MSVPGTSVMTTLPVCFPLPVKLLTVTCNVYGLPPTVPSTSLRVNRSGKLGVPQAYLAPLTGWSKCPATGPLSVASTVAAPPPLVGAAPVAVAAGAADGAATDGA